MNPRWIIGLVILLLGLGLMGGMVEGTYMSDNSTTGTLEKLVSPDMLAGTDLPVVGPAVVGISMMWSYTQAFWTMLWFDYPFFEGPWVIVRLLFLGLSAGIIFSIMLAVFRGTSSG